MFDLSDPSYTQGQLDADLTNAFDARRRQNKANALLRRERYVAGSLENVAANKARRVQAWDDVVWEIVKRVKDFDPETRYRLLGVCRGEDATPEDTMRALRKCQEFQYQQIKANAPEDNSDTEIPGFRREFYNDRI